MMKRIALSGVVRGIAIASGLVLAGLGTMYAAGSHTARVKQELTPTSMAPDAKGKANLTLRSSKHGKFRVLTKHLQGDKQFDLIVGGVKVGVLNTNGGGNARARFSTQPGAKDTLLGFDPRGARVVVRDEEDGEDVLEGDMPDDDDGTTVACCISEQGDDDNQGDEEGGGGDAECEELTPEECKE